MPVPDIPPWVVPVGVGIIILACIVCPECCMVVVIPVVAKAEKPQPADVPRRVREKKRTGHTDVSGR